MIIIRFSMLLMISDVCMGVNKNFKWTPELSAVAVKIFHETSSKGRSHQAEMKQEWDKIYPQYNGISQRTLRRHALTVIYKRSTGGRNHIPWTPELRSEVTRMYRDILHSSERSPACKLHGVFYDKYPDLPRVTPSTLWNRARAIYEKCQPNVTKDKLLTRIPWSTKHAEDVLRIYREQQPGNNDQARRLYEEWIKLHPEHTKITPRFIQIRMREVARRKAEKGEVFQTAKHKWTGQENADLLHIYHRINPSETGFTLRIQERWKEMNPNLRNMKRDHLRRRAQRLIKHNYKPSESEDAAARVKFDTSSLPENVGHRGSTLSKKDKGKAIIMDPAPEHLAFMSSGSHNPHQYQFYDFMFVNKSHGKSPYISDENIQNTDIASTSQTPYHNRDTSPRPTNYLDEERDTSSSQQHTDTAPTFPSDNPQREFFTFL